MHIAIINGPGLNRIGRRQPEIYGSSPFSLTFEKIQREFPNVKFTLFQSNSEGDIISCIQKLIEADEPCHGLIINPGAYAHYSFAIADAIADAMDYFNVVEVHISNIAAREDFRHTSVTAARASAFLSGFGLNGYLLAACHLANASQK